MGDAGQYEEWRKRAYIGPLPSGFLRLQECPPQQQAVIPHMAYQNIGKLSITIAQAKLVKNYGMVTMDPYVRLRIGHSVYKTPTASNGGKNPHWHKVIQCYLPPGITKIYVEIYDEFSFMMDELIAWGHIDIPPQVLQRGETHEDWYLLSGAQGENQEGTINLVFSYTMTCHPYGDAAVAAGQQLYLTPYTFFGVYGGGNTPPVTIMPVPDQAVVLRELGEMFPNIDKETIKVVYEGSGSNKEMTISTLLDMVE